MRILCGILLLSMMGTLASADDNVLPDPEPERTGAQTAQDDQGDDGADDAQSDQAAGAQGDQGDTDPAPGSADFVGVSADPEAVDGDDDQGDFTDSGSSSQGVQVQSSAAARSSAQRDDSSDEQAGGQVSAQSLTTITSFSPSYPSDIVHRVRITTDSSTHAKSSANFPVYLVSKSGVLCKIGTAYSPSLSEVFSFDAGDCKLSLHELYGVRITTTSTDGWIVKYLQVQYGPSLALYWSPSGSSSLVDHPSHASITWKRPVVRVTTKSVQYAESSANFAVYLVSRSGYKCYVGTALSPSQGEQFTFTYLSSSCPIKSPSDIAGVHIGTSQSDGWYVAYVQVLHAHTWFTYYAHGKADSWVDHPTYKSVTWTRPVVTIATGYTSGHQSDASFPVYLVSRTGSTCYLGVAKSPSLGEYFYFGLPSSCGITLENFGGVRITTKSTDGWYVRWVRVLHKDTGIYYHVNGEKHSWVDSPHDESVTWKRPALKIVTGSTSGHQSKANFPVYLVSHSGAKCYVGTVYSPSLGEVFYLDLPWSCGIHLKHLAGVRISTTQTDGWYINYIQVLHVNKWEYYYADGEKASWVDYPHYSSVTWRVPVVKVFTDSIAYSHSSHNFPVYIKPSTSHLHCLFGYAYSPALNEVFHFTHRSGCFYAGYQVEKVRVTTTSTDGWKVKYVQVLKGDKWVTYYHNSKTDSWVDHPHDTPIEWVE